jgi:hypothetical protein
MGEYRGFQLGFTVGVLDALAALAPRDWSRIELVMRRSGPGAFELDFHAVAGGGGPSAMLDPAHGKAQLAIHARELAGIAPTWNGRMALERDASGACRVDVGFDAWTLGADALARRSFGPGIITSLGETYYARMSRQHELEQAYGPLDPSWVMDPLAATLTTPKGKLAIDLLAAYIPPELRFATALSDLPEALTARALELARSPAAPPSLGFDVRVVLAPSYARALAELVGHALGSNGIVEWPHGDDTLYFGVRTQRPA